MISILNRVVFQVQWPRFTMIDLWTLLYYKYETSICPCNMIFPDIKTIRLQKASDSWRGKSVSCCPLLWKACVITKKPVVVSGTVYGDKEGKCTSETNATKKGKTRFCSVEQHWPCPTQKGIVVKKEKAALVLKGLPTCVWGFHWSWLQRQMFMFQSEQKWANYGISSKLQLNMRYDTSIG